MPPNARAWQRMTPPAGSHGALSTSTHERPVSGRTRASDLLGELLAQRVLLIDADRPQHGASHAIGFDTALAAQELEQRASGIVHPAARLLRCSDRGCGAFPDAALSAAQKNVRSQPDDTGIQ